MRSTASENVQSTDHARHGRVDACARRSIGHGSAPTFTADGAILAARKGTIVRFEGSTDPAVVIERDGWELDAPQPSPTGKHLLYRAMQRNRLELRVRDVGDGSDRVLLDGDRDRTLTLWARDETAVYAVVGHDAHWRVLRLPLTHADAIELARDIASFADLELSPGGTQLALTAASDPAYPTPIHTLYTIDLSSQSVNEYAIEGGDAREVTWISPDELIVAVRAVPRDGEATIPATRSLRRVSLATGTTTAFP